MGLPVICTEWEEGHVAAIADIADLEVLETVSNGHGLLDLW